MTITKKAAAFLWGVQNLQSNPHKRLPTDESTAQHLIVSKETARDWKAQYMAMVASGWTPKEDVLEVANKVAAEHHPDPKNEVVQDRKMETDPSIGTQDSIPESFPEEAKSPVSPVPIEPVQTEVAKKKNGFHIHSFLNVALIQILFSALAVLDVYRHFENYIEYFARFQSLGSAWVSALLNAVPVVALPAAVVFAMLHKKYVLGVFLAITFIPCVMYSVNVTNANLDYHSSNKIAETNVDNKEQVKAQNLIKSLESEKTRLEGEVSSLKLQSDAVAPKLSLPSTIKVDGKEVYNNDYYSAKNVINANDKIMKSKGDRLAEIDKQLQSLYSTTDTTATVVEKKSVDEVMNWAQAIFLDLLGVASVLIAFFL